MPRSSRCAILTSTFLSYCALWIFRQERSIRRGRMLRLNLGRVLRDVRIFVSGGSAVFLKNVRNVSYPMSFLWS